MHSNDKLGLNESASLLGIGQLPYLSQSLIGEPGLVKDLPRLLAGEHACLQRLTLEQASVLDDLVGGQGRDADGTAGALGLYRRGRWGRRPDRRAGWCGWDEDAIESRKRSLLQC